jgi:hypothetical protein
MIKMCRTIPSHDPIIDVSAAQITYTKHRIECDRMLFDDSEEGFGKEWTRPV